MSALHWVRNLTTFSQKWKFTPLQCQHLAFFLRQVVGFLEWFTMTYHRKHFVIPVLVVLLSAQSKGASNVAILQNSTSKNESFKNETLVGASKAQNANMQENRASKSSLCTQDVLVTGQQYNDDSHTAPAPPSENLDKKGACVKNSKHIFEDQKCLPGGSKGLTDNDNFDLWTSLGSVNEFQNYGSLPDSVKKLIHKNKDVFCSKLTAVRHIKSDPVKISNLVETLQSSTFKNVSTMNVETSESSTLFFVILLKLHKVPLLKMLVLQIVL